MSDTIQLPLDAELDFSGDALEPQVTTLYITDITREDLDGDGERVRIVFKFEGNITQGGEERTVPVRETAWEAHPNPVAARMGRKTVRLIGKAVTGNENFSLATLIGSSVTARISEDENGFLKADRWGA